MPRLTRALSILTILVGLASSAAAKEKEITTSFIAYEPMAAVDSLGDVEIVMRGLWGSPDDHPDDFAFSSTDLVAARIAYRQEKHLPPDAHVFVGVEDWFAKDPLGLRRINPFMAPNGTTGLFAFHVTVRNRGAAAIRVDPSSLTLSGGGESVPPATDLAFYDRWILGQEVAMDRRKTGPITLIQKGYTIRHVPYPVGIAGAVLAQRVPRCCAALFGRTVELGGAASGYVLFPVEWGADSVEVRVRVEGVGERVVQFERVDRVCRWDGERRRWVADEDSGL